MLLSMSSGKVLHGLVEIDRGIHSFTQFGEAPAASISSSTRLKLWHRSLQAMTEHPVLGAGAGSWEKEFDRQEMLQGTTKFVREAGNPHQEYLLWGVELGALGLLLLLSLLAVLGLTSRSLERPSRRALLSVSLALALACLFNSVLYDALIGDFFCIALGLLLALGRYSEPPHQAGAFQ
jgi:O-antigen ligase